MKTRLVISLSCLFLFCRREEAIVEMPCDTVATLRDLRGKKMCDWVFELENKTYLQTAYSSTNRYVSSPIPGYIPRNGQRVRIGYRVVSGPGCPTGMCEVGSLVELTCLEASPDKPQ